MTPEDAIKAIDHASNMSDRWLFLAALVVIVVGGVMIIRYLVNQLDNQRNAHMSLVEKMSVALHDCAAMMKELREAVLKLGR